MAGSPARIIRYRFTRGIITRLLSIAFWNWDDEKISINKELFYDIEKFVEKFYVNRALEAIVKANGNDYMI